MMGRLNRDQGQLFYCFNLEEAVPEDHQVRRIAEVLDLSWVRAELAPCYSPVGRPSIDPVLMIIVEPNLRLTLSPELGMFSVWNDTPSLVTRSCARSQLENLVNAVTKTCSWQVEPSARAGSMVAPNAECDAQATR